MTEINETPQENLVVESQVASPSEQLELNEDSREKLDIRQVFFNRIDTIRERTENMSEKLKADLFLGAAAITAVAIPALSTMLSDNPEVIENSTNLLKFEGLAGMMLLLVASAVKIRKEGQFKDRNGLYSRSTYYDSNIPNVAGKIRDPFDI